MPNNGRTEVVLAETGILESGLYRKRILYEGRFLHPGNPEKFFDITKAHFADIQKNFKDKVLDRVQLYWTHEEDPRGIAGEVVDLEEGEDPKDKKNSLYAIVKPTDQAAADKMSQDEVGTSAALDNVYREHLEGQPVGTLLRHLAIVGEGWIKQLGGFMPLRLADTTVYLQDGGAVFVGGKTEKNKDDSVDLDQLTTEERKKLSNKDFAYVDKEGVGHLPIQDASHVRNALSRFDQTQFEDDAKKAAAKRKITAAASKFGVDVKLADAVKQSAVTHEHDHEHVAHDNLPAYTHDHEHSHGADTKEHEHDHSAYMGDKGKKGDVVDTKEAIELLQKEGIDVAKLQETAGKAAAFRKALKLDDTVADPFAEAVKIISGNDERFKKLEAETTVNALLADNKIKPAQKDQFIKLYMTDKDLFVDMTKDLAKGASGVILGEKGKKIGEEGEGPTDEEKIKAGALSLVEVGTPMKGHEKNGKDK